MIGSKMIFNFYCKVISRKMKILEPPRYTPRIANMGGVVILPWHNFGNVSGGIHFCQNIWLSKKKCQKLKKKCFFLENFRIFHFIKVYFDIFLVFKIFGGWRGCPRGRRRPRINKKPGIKNKSVPFFLIRGRG